MTTYALFVTCTSVDTNQYPVLVAGQPDNGWQLKGSLASSTLLRDTVVGLNPQLQQNFLQNPTVACVGDSLRQIASAAMRDDLVVFSYSGHGARIDEPPRAAELTILLYDRMMVANEYGAYLSAFREGVRFVNIIDGCGLSTFLNLAVGGLGIPPEDGGGQRSGSAPVRRRSNSADLPATPTNCIPLGIDNGVYAELKNMHANIYREFAAPPALKLRGVNFGACRSTEAAYSCDQYSFFTECITYAMKERPANYVSLREVVEHKLARLTAEVEKPPMHPTLSVFGTATRCDLERPPFT